MRCEVCGHKIPIGQKMCPNCGFRLDKDPIVVEEPSIHLKEYETQKKLIKLKPIKKTNNIKNVGNKSLIILGVIIFSLLLFVMLGPRSVEYLSVDEILESDRDDSYGSAEFAKEYRVSLMKGLEKAGFVEIFASEKICEYDGILNISCVINAQKEGINDSNHMIFYDIEAGNLNQLIYDGSSHIDDFSLDEIDKLSDLLGYDSLKNILNKIDIKLEEGYTYENDILTIRIDSFYSSGMNIYYRIAGNGYSLGG